MREQTEINAEKILRLILSVAHHPVEQLDYASPVAFRIDHRDLLKASTIVYENPDIYADQLLCISGIDNGKEQNTLELVYHFASITKNILFSFNVQLNRDSPRISSLVGLWKSANWMEREAYDMFGIIFSEHPDLRRILMPADWAGHPLRKDYNPEENYHGIKISADQDDQSK
jgi:NADH-quinone oxidoreductase subunit C